MRACAMLVALFAASYVVVAQSAAEGASVKPSITSVLPAYGPSSGGTTVSILGKNFTGATAVDFGTIPAASFVVNSPIGITATSPPGVGTVNVVVTTPSGTTKANSSDKFNYGPNVACPTPPVAGCPITPSYGPPAGGTQLTITGTNFTGATAVNFGSTVLTAGTNPPSAPGTFFVASDTEILAESPPGNGLEAVSVVTPGGTSHVGSSDSFDYGPSVTCPSPPTGGCPVSPNFGPPAGGTIVTIGGTNFTGATMVNFGTASLTPVVGAPTTGTFEIVSDTEILADSPAGTGVVDVIVTTPGGTSQITSADHFSYAPIVNSISPTSGPATGGTSVTITGGNFTGVTAVDFGSKPAISFIFNSDTSVTAVSPAGKAPSVNVTVTTPGGTSQATSGSVFSYGPAVAIVKPNAGVGSGGTKVQVVGSGFKAVTAVYFGGSLANSFKVKSSGKIIAYAPAGTGLVDVTVKSAAGSSAIVTTDEFDYAPTVTSVSPVEGKASGGKTITIRGTNFTGVTGVDFGANAATSFTVVSTTKITAVDPPGTGLVDVTVVTLGGTSPITPSDHFIYG